MTRETIHTGSQKRAPTSAAEDREVQDFFDRMGRSLTAGDAGTVAGMWAVPAYVIGDAMAQAITSREDIEKFFAGAKGEYNKRGITDTRADIASLEWIGDRIVVADIRWPYLDAHGNEVGGESSTYTLRRDDAGQLKLHIALMRGEER
ncbi:MAG TPA: hypothetical protein VJ717_03715 [Gemmatimonadaceae bacterium]|nr:hypothetical protein [Gemmatimonadaceae bacterium]